MKIGTEVIVKTENFEISTQQEGVVNSEVKISLESGAESSNQKYEVPIVNTENVDSSQQKDSYQGFIQNSEVTDTIDKEVCFRDFIYENPIYDAENTESSTKIEDFTQNTEVSNKLDSEIESLNKEYENPKVNTKIFENEEQEVFLNENFDSTEILDVEFEADMSDQINQNPAVNMENSKTSVKEDPEQDFENNNKVTESMINNAASLDQIDEKPKENPAETKGSNQEDSAQYNAKKSELDKNEETQKQTSYKSTEEKKDRDITIDPKTPTTIGKNIDSNPNILISDKRNAHDDHKDLEKMYLSDEYNNDEDGYDKDSAEDLEYLLEPIEIEMKKIKESDEGSSNMYLEHLFKNEQFAIPQLNKQDTLDYYCEKHICIIAFFPEVHSGNLRDFKEKIDSLAELRNLKRHKIINFLWAQGGDFIRFEKVFGLSKTYPSLLALRLTKQRYSVLKQKFTMLNIKEFYTKIVSGGLALQSFESLPILREVERYGEDY